MFSLVALWHGNRCLMVFNRFRRAWELPGGMLDSGESPRAAALRELEEESGQVPDVLDFAGVARLRVAPDDRPEYGAIYRGRIAAPVPFVPNNEMSHAMWWDPAVPVDDMLAIDAALARLCS